MAKHRTYKRYKRGRFAPKGRSPRQASRPQDQPASAALRARVAG